KTPRQHRVDLPGAVRDGAQTHRQPQPAGERGRSTHRAPQRVPCRNGDPGPPGRQASRARIASARMTQKASVEELLEEVERSPRGPEVGAFFDFDGTLIAGYSASAFYQDRIRRFELTAGELVRSVAAWLEM